MKYQNNSNQQPAGPFRFCVNDILHLPSLAEKLYQQSDLVSQFLKGRFSAQTLQSLSDFIRAGSNPEVLKVSLVQECNEIIKGELIYEANRFAGVSLSVDTQALLRTSAAVGPSPTARSCSTPTASSGRSGWAWPSATAVSLRSSGCFRDTLQGMPQR